METILVPRSTVSYVSFMNFCNECNVATGIIRGDLDGNRGCVMGLRCFYHSYAGHDVGEEAMCVPPPLFISPGP